MTNGRYTVGNQSGKSASIRIANLNGDQHLDLVVANGRHWPQPNYLFFNQGRGSFTVQRQIGLDGCTSYAAEPADLDGDGDVDLAIGNDRAPNQIFLNDGDGNFILSGTFGEPSSVRSLTISDLDQDGDPDILTTCRGRQNQIFLNDGSGQFPQSKEFGPEGSSTIDVAVVDWNLDGHLDLVLANRWQEARNVYRWYTPLLKLDTLPKLVQYIKLAVQECGYGSELTRAPRLVIEGAEREEVLAIIRKGIETRPNPADFGM